MINYAGADSVHWDFGGLASFLHAICSPGECTRFFESTLPAIIRFALELEYSHLVIAIMQQGAPAQLRLDQQDMTRLLANAFLCTFPGRSENKYSMPYVNFNYLFETQDGACSTKQAGKLRCLLHYFERVSAHRPNGSVLFQRCCLSERPLWEAIDMSLCKLDTFSQGTIEDDATGIQVDFANKDIGGGVLHTGSVQEEIRFCVRSLYRSEQSSTNIHSPELIVARLFVQRLRDDECLFVHGAERFSNYTGYASSFAWAGNYIDRSPRDEWGTRATKLVAIDALRYHNYSAQFRMQHIERELNKAACGFAEITNAKEPIATGNWGCGAFNGDRQLKVSSR